MQGIIVKAVTAAIEHNSDKWLDWLPLDWFWPHMRNIRSTEIVNEE